MDEIIKIKCPFDGAVLSVKSFPGIETKSVTCPICKHKYPFTQFKKVVEKTPQPSCGEHTQLPTVNFNIGKLVHLESGATFTLKPGRNVIGRKASNSTADFMIDTGDMRGLSRSHIVVEVRKEPAKGFVHYVSLFKERVNPTSVNNMPLLFGDCVILEDGATLKLPDCTLKFRLADSEATDI